MTLVPSVTELILAELLYLQYEDKSKPIYLYINSTGTSKVSYFWVSRECIQCFTKFLSMTPPAFSAGGAEIRLRYWSICNIWYHEICQPASSHRGCRHSVGRSRDVARIRGKGGRETAPRCRTDWLRKSSMLPGKSGCTSFCEHHDKTAHWCVPRTGATRFEVEFDAGFFAANRCIAQATELEIQRKEMRNTKKQTVCCFNSSFYKIRLTVCCSAWTFIHGNQ